MNVSAPLIVSIALVALLAAGCGKTDNRPVAKPAAASKPTPPPIAAKSVSKPAAPIPAATSTPVPLPTSSAPPYDKPVRIITWNVKEMFRPIQAEYRTTGFTRFAEELQPDILLIEEVVSPEVVAKLRDVMKLDAKHLACSNFVTNSEDHAAFEVAIISKFPLDEVIEYDTVLDGKSSDHQPGDPEERLLAPPVSLGLAPLDPAEPPRGFLWARIDALKLCVCVCHLKSSRGGAGAEDLKNAEKREFVAAAIAARVNEERKARPDYTFLVAGDLNVGCHDKKKNGRDLKVDDTSDDLSRDRYDETHALLGDGLVDGLKMKNLALGIQEGTFIVDFPGTGPIDNIYVVGPAAARFAPAQKAERAYSSDHYPVWTVLAPK